MSIAKRVAARYYLHRLRPTLEVPNWVRTRVAFDPGEGFVEAKLSLNAMLERFMFMISKATGERYQLGASESRGVVYYFFTGRHHLDAFSIALSVPRAAQVLVSYVPFDFDRRPQLDKRVEVVKKSAPEVAGMALMRATRELLGEIKQRQLVARVG